jgi:hypothetical protein
MLHVAVYLRLLQCSVMQLTIVDSKLNTVSLLLVSLLFVQLVTVGHDASRALATSDYQVSNTITSIYLCCADNNCYSTIQCFCAH